MDRSEVITLIAQNFTQDSLNVPRELSTTERDVFAQVQNVTGLEWFEGGRNGLNPEYRFTMFKYDYDGEQIVRYKDVEYSVYRTYERRTDEIELYCEKRKGAQR
ncbi:MAG: phage head closure protein [Prevotella sp.]|nr:phage head closure protein [Prevotella sp.]MBR2096641.1 phage head closure protein [Prevotella sp.]